MKDWLFYPLAIIFIVAMVVFAYTRGEDTNVSTGSNFIVEGQNLDTFYAAQGVSFSIAGDVNNPAAYAVLSAHVARDIAPPSAGVFVTLPPSYKNLYAGKLLRVSVTARKGRASKLESFDVAYLSTDAGTSGWQSFDLSTEFETFSFTFKPRLPASDPGSDYVGIWPDVEGKSRTLDVKKIEISILDDQKD